MECVLEFLPDSTHKDTSSNVNIVPLAAELCTHGVLHANKQTHIEKKSNEGAIIKASKKKSDINLIRLPCFACSIFFLEENLHSK